MNPPPCSVCGYVVDYLRSCYRSNWRLYPDRPDVLTPGRYYFVPSDTPDYPGPQLFTSLNWIRGPGVEPYDLGQVEGPQPWDRGDPPPRLPLPVLIGSADCVRRGMTYDPTPRPTYNGIDVRCYPLPVLPFPVTFDQFDVDDPYLWLVLAQLLDWLYDNPGKIPPVIADWLGPTAAVSVVENSASVIPGSAIISTPNYILVCISGTSNPQQLALQALYSVFPLSGNGPFATLLLWAFAADAIHQRVRAIDPTGNLPVIFTGHSYGAAIAVHLAAIYRSHQPQRKIALVTFGLPNPGPAELRNVLSDIPRTHLANVDDPVPHVPPSDTDLGVFGLVVPNDVRARWNRFRPLDRQVVLFPDGAWYQTDATTWDLLSIRSTVAAALMNAPTDPIDGHRQRTYVARLQLAAPGPGRWPIPPAVYDQLQPARQVSFRLRLTTEPGGSIK